MINSLLIEIILFTLTLAGVVTFYFLPELCRYHPVSGGSGGTVFQLENDSKENIRLHNLMVNALISETKMKKAEIEKIMKIGYDYYITADEAVRLGIVDSIV